jgi:peptidoglycan/LPS O-acetylase OafA/YrhL
MNWNVIVMVLAVVVLAAASLYFYEQQSNKEFILKDFLTRATDTAKFSRTLTTVKG